MSSKTELQPGKEAEALDSQSAASRSKSKTLIAPARACSVLLSIILLLSASAPAEERGPSANTNTVRLKTQTELPGPNIMLGDVADVHGPNAERLAEVDLGPVPWPGTRRLIDATVVKIKLYGDNVDYTKVQITGDGCIVSTKTVTVPGQEILDVARELLLERLPWPAEDVQIEIEEKPANREVPAGSGRPTLEASMAGGFAAGGKARVIVTGKAHGRSLFRTTVCFLVHVFEEIVVARRDIHQGEIFNEDNVAGRRLDVTALSPGNLYSEAAALIGKRAARSIRTGMPIARQVVIVPPVIKRGDMVQIVFKTPFLSLTARGLSKESGAPGQMIRVQNIDSGREVIGRVTPGGQVSVAF